MRERERERERVRAFTGLYEVRGKSARRGEGVLGIVA